jgi:hypothetical protein
VDVPVASDAIEIARIEVAVGIGAVVVLFAVRATELHAVGDELVLARREQFTAFGTAP